MVAVVARAAIDDDALLPQLSIVAKRAWSYKVIFPRFFRGLAHRKPFLSNMQLENRPARFMFLDTRDESSARWVNIFRLKDVTEPTLLSGSILTSKLSLS